MITLKKYLKKIETLNSQIDEKNKEIDYMLKSIEKNKERHCKERRTNERTFICYANNI